MSKLRSHHLFRRRGIFFEEGAIDRNVLRAIRDAKRLRRALRAADEITSSAPREYVHRR
jgi:hypothetical protein